ncbi:hypothetical protein [Lysobacter gummosus]|uniref:hypothetical protein n=1 Tax=Lysobacter gummosus TaxID=262324 RepID=UPI0036267EE3
MQTLAADQSGPSRTTPESAQTQTAALAGSRCACSDVFRIASATRITSARSACGTYRRGRWCP